MKCTECGNATIKTVGDHVYRESGLDNVTLQSVVQYECERCGAKRVTIQALGPLHRVIARAIARKPARLEPSEVRFVRDHLELSNKDFAVLMGVSEAQSSRWSSSEPIGVPAERFLRLLATMGAIALAAGTPTIEIGNPEAFAADVRSTLSSLPSRDEPVRRVPIRLRRGSDGWREVITASA